MAEYPEQKSARAYNTVVGHLSGLAMGFAAVAILQAWDAPTVLSTHDLSAIRIWVSVVAMALTSGMIVILRASHPPAGSTALLVSLGSFSTWADVQVVVIGVVIIAAIGEMFRYIRLSNLEK
jgi:HPP family